MGWFVAALEKYAVLGGRSRRREYWFFVLFTGAITLLLMLIDGAIGTVASSTGLGLQSAILSQAILAPSIAWK